MWWQGVVVPVWMGKLGCWFLVEIGVNGRVYWDLEVEMVSTDGDTSPVRPTNFPVVLGLNARMAVWTADVPVPEALEIRGGYMTCFVLQAMREYRNCFGISIQQFKFTTSTKPVNVCSISARSILANMLCVPQYINMQCIGVGIQWYPVLANNFHPSLPVSGQWLAMNFNGVHWTEEIEEWKLILENSGTYWGIHHSRWGSLGVPLRWKHRPIPIITTGIWPVELTVPFEQKPIICY